MSARASIGIDFGNTFSFIATWNSKDHSVKIIPNGLWEETTPSCVAFTDSSGVAYSETIVGAVAKLQCHRNAANTIFNVKRLIGRKYDDFAIQSDIPRWSFRQIVERVKRLIGIKYDDPPIECDIKQWAFKIVRGERGYAAIEVDYAGRKWSFSTEYILCVMWFIQIP